MRDYCFLVPFEIGNRSEQVFASNKNEAVILAQAAQIKKGNRYDDVDYENITTLE
jgi:hypothetical protein